MITPDMDTFPLKTIQAAQAIRLLADQALITNGIGSNNTAIG